MKHPREAELALFAGGECGMVSRFFLGRHVRDCRQCATVVARFEILRADMMRPDAPDFDWRHLEAEMRANIRLGLEAGTCVRPAVVAKPWNPRPAVAFASLIVLAGAGFLLRGPAVVIEPPLVKAPQTVLESTGAGLELRNGSSSLTLINRHGAVADQTVSAQGEIGVRYIEGGSVTINNVYLE